MIVMVSAIFLPRDPSFEVGECPHRSEMQCVPVELRLKPAVTAVFVQ